MLAFLEDLVRRMIFVGQDRDVMQRRDIVHGFRSHKGVSVDEGDGLGVAKLGSHNHKPFQNRIVPPSLFHIVAARSPIASDGFLPRLDRHGAIVARRSQRSDCLSGAERCCQERRPLRRALALSRLFKPRSGNSVADLGHVQVPMRVVSGWWPLLDLTVCRSDLVPGFLAVVPRVALQTLW
jgi:hypothetical protein